MKKVIYILSHLSPPPFELETYRREVREREIVRMTRELGYKSELFLLSYASEVTQMNDEVGSWFFPIDDPPTSHRKRFTSTEMRDRLDRERPDLVVFKGLGFKLNRWLVTRCRHKFAYALSVGGGTKDVLVPFADYILGETSEQLASFYSRHWQRGRATVLPKLLQSNRFRSSERKDFDIVCVGSFKPRKNFRALLPLFGRYRIALLGDGEEYQSIRREALPHGNSVFMPGDVSPEDVPDYISRARILVHPATSEGFPRAIVEAFACGVPVVALEKTAQAVFTNGIEGLLVREENLVREVEQLLSSPYRIDQMGARAYRYARTNCTAEAVRKVIANVYEQVNESFPNAHVLAARNRRIVLKSIGWRAREVGRLIKRLSGLAVVKRAIRRVTGTQR